MSDLISRQQAIDAIEEYFARIGKLKRRGLNNGEKAIALDTVGAIKSLPSAQPEIAKRIVGKSRDGMTLWYQCDMCYEPVDEKDIFCRGCGRRFENG